MAKAKATATKTRETITLPQTVTSAEAAWPGSARGGGSRNAVLRGQLEADLAGMELGSVRRYDVPGDDKVQEAFVNLFRRICDDVHGPIYGVQAVKQDGAVFVKLGNRRANKS